MKRGLVLCLMFLIFSTGFISSAILSTEVQITPYIPISSENLTCNVIVISDSSSSGMTADYIWYKNGIEDSSGSFSINNNTNTSLVLSSGNTTENDIWVCNVRVTDGSYGEYVNSSVFVRGELSIDRALINYRNASDRLVLGKMLEKRFVGVGVIYDGDMGSYFGRAPMVFKEDGSEAHVVFRDGSYILRVYGFDWDSWSEMQNHGSANRRGSISVDRYGDTLIAIWGDSDLDDEPPVYSISLDGGTTWTSEEFIPSAYNKFGYGNTLEFKFLDDGTGIAIWKSSGSGVGWAYAYWNGTGWEHLGIVLDSNTGAVGRADLSVIPGGNAFLIYQNSNPRVYSWNGSGFDNDIYLDSSSNGDDHNGPTIDCNRNGQCVAVWTDSGYEQEYMRYNGTNWEGNPNIDIDGSDTWSDSHAQAPNDIQVDDQGNAFLIWYDESEVDVLYATYNWSTDSWTQGQDFISYTTSDIEYGDSAQVALVPLNQEIFALPIEVTANLSDDEVFTNESVEGYCSSLDLDNATVNYSYIWYRNGLYNYSGSFSGFANGTAILADTLFSNKTSRGDTWTFSCSANDGSGQVFSSNVSFYVVTPNNNIHFENSFPLPVDDLICNLSVINPEVPTGLTAYYQWYKDGVLQTSGNLPVSDSESYELTMSSDNTRTDEIWTCSAMVSDGVVNGTWKNTSVAIRMKTSISDAFIAWNDASYQPIWTTINGSDFVNQTISSTRVLSSGGSNLVRFVLSPGLFSGKLIYNAADGDLYMYSWNGTSWGGETMFADQSDTDNTYDIARFGDTIIVVWGISDSSVPYYRISRDGGSTWSTQTRIESSTYGKFAYHSGLDFEFLSDGTGLLIHKHADGTTGWIWSFWNGSVFSESGVLDETDDGQHAKASIAALENGGAFVVRRSGDMSQVYLNKWDGTSFESRVTLDTTTYGYPGGPEIECNIYGICLMIHRASDGDLEYMRYNGSSWSGQDVDIDGASTWSINYVNSVIDLAMDDYNNSILVWYSSDRLETRWANYSWEQDSWAYQGVLGVPHPALSYGDGVQVGLEMPFDEPPSVVNITERGDYNSIDPLDPLTIEAYVYDQESNFNLGVLEWTNGNGTWNIAEVYNETPYSFTTRINATFIPDSEGNYTYRLLMYDEQGNFRMDSEQNVSVFWDCSWSVDDSLGSFAGWNEIKNLGNINLSNLGDSEYSGGCSLDFRVSYNLEEGRVYYDGEYLKNSFIYSLNEKESLNISIDVEFLSEIKQEELEVIFDEPRQRSDSRYHNTSVVLISNQAGPYLFGEITSFPQTVYLTNSDFSLSGYVRNVMGDIIPNETNTAYNTTIEWQIPNGFSQTSSGFFYENISDLISYSIPTIISFSNLAEMSPGLQTFNLSAQGVNLTGGEIINSLGDPGFFETASINFLCYYVSDGVCVEACGNSQDVDCPIQTIEVSGGGSGGGGSSSGDLFDKSEATIELVRGEEQSFQLRIENKLSSPKENIFVEVSGINSEYIQLNPSNVSFLDKNSYIDINVSISSPKYFNYGKYLLSFEIEGEMVTNKSRLPFKELRYITLYIVELKRDSAINLLNQSENLIFEMNDSGLKVENLIEILNEMNISLGNYDYGALKLKYEDLLNIYNSASQSKQIIEELNLGIERANKKGIDVTETQKLLFISEVAFERGDYILALERLNQAKLSYALEVKGEFNIIYEIKNNPLEFLGILMGLGVFGFGGSLATRRVLYKKKIKLLEDEEKLLLELMKVVQRDCFQRNKLSMEEYQEAMHQYENKLSEAIQDKIKFQAKLANLMRLKPKRDILNEERLNLVEIMKKIQIRYLKEAKVETRIYENMMKSYSSRLSEIEEKIVFLDAKESLKQGKSFGRLFK